MNKSIKDNNEANQARERQYYPRMSPETMINIIIAFIAFIILICLAYKYRPTSEGISEAENLSKYNNTNIVSDIPEIGHIYELNEINYHSFFDKKTSELVPYAEAGTKDLGNGLKISVCWCYAIKVKEYNPEYDWDTSLSIDNKYKITQDKSTRDLIIEDVDNHMISRYNNKDQYTYSLVYDGTQSLRFNYYSIYYWENGQIDINYGGESTMLRDKNGVLTGEVDTTIAKDLSELNKLIEENSAWFMVRLLNLEDVEIEE